MIEFTVRKKERKEESKKVKLLSCVCLFATPWTVAYQASPSMGFSRQEYQSGLPFPSPGDLPDTWIDTQVSWLQADALPSELPGKPTVVILLPVCSPGSAALLSVGKAGLNEPHICLPWSLAIMVDGKHQTDMGVGSQWSGYFLQSSLLWQSIQDGSCVLPWV